MSEYYNEQGLPPTIPPPEWVHNVTCYTPLLLDDTGMVEANPVNPVSIGNIGSIMRALMLVTSTLAVIVFNAMFIYILNSGSYPAASSVRPQPRILFTAMAINDLANGVFVMGFGMIPAVVECWPYGEIFCKIQVSIIYPIVLIA